MFMNKIIEKIYDLAKESYNIDEIPVGALIVKNNEIISTGINSRESNNSVIGHAEIDAIEKACRVIGDWRLDDCEMYVTLEPCVMCAGAIIQSRVKRVVYGALDYRFGAHQSITNLFDLKLNHKVEVTSGILEEECSFIYCKFSKFIQKNKICAYDKYEIWRYIEHRKYLHL